MEMEIEKYTTAVRKRHLDEATPLVISKLQDLTEEASFDRTRWRFSWDANLHPLDNISKCNAELQVLRRLQVEKIIGLSAKATPDIESYGNKEYRHMDDYKISDSQYVTAESDEAGRHYHTAVWLTGFDIDRFRRYAERMGVRAASSVGGTARLSMNGNSLMVELPSGEHRLIKTLRTDGAPLNFINHLLAHPNNNIGRGVIQTIVEGCQGHEDMTELARNCGFNQYLKALFFPGTTKASVRLTPSPQVTAKQADTIITITNRSESEKIVTQL